MGTRSNRVLARLQTPFGPSRAANLASKTANMAAKTANLAAKTAQLAVRRPSRARSGATLERPGTTRSAQKRPKPIFRRFFDVLGRFFVDFSSLGGRNSVGCTTCRRCHCRPGRMRNIERGGCFFARASHVFLWVFACLCPGFPMLYRTICSPACSTFPVQTHLPLVAPRARLRVRTFPCRHTLPPSILSDIPIRWPGVLGVASPYTASTCALTSLRTHLGTPFGRSCEKKFGCTSLLALVLVVRTRFRRVLAALGIVFGGRNVWISARLGSFARSVLTLSESNKTL